MTLLPPLSDLLLQFLVDGFRYVIFPLVENYAEDIAAISADLFLHVFHHLPACPFGLKNHHNTVGETCYVYGVWGSRHRRRINEDQVEQGFQ